MTERMGRTGNRKEGEMTYQLKAWTKPGTDETRVYINAPRLNAKVWLFLDREFGLVDVATNSRDPRDYPTMRTQGGVKPHEKVAEDALKANGLAWGIAEWDDIMKVAQ